MLFAIIVINYFLVTVALFATINYSEIFFSPIAFNTKAHISDVFFHILQTTLQTFTFNILKACGISHGTAI